MNGLAAMARKHQPGLLVVDRCVTGPNENYITPEGESSMPGTRCPYPWEACMPIGKHWNYSGQITSGNGLGDPGYAPQRLMR